MSKHTYVRVCMRLYVYTHIYLLLIFCLLYKNIALSFLSFDTDDYALTKAVTEVVNRAVVKMNPNTANNDDDGAKATESWVSVNGVATRVLCWGQPIDENGDGKGLDRVVLFVCGNPGVSEFYEKFLQEVYKALKVPVWITSHAGMIFIFLFV